ncbi:ATP-binding protein [Microbacterium sp. SYP-A9085]|uniref:sensor histidine kinase n=1 Tax=Microbacterium sp. SYP-A9085 TaxID=2664454 RepID=UPI001327A98B|nr:ATP-binding protein [Microbacterium sp. SYP-A9085]
MTPPPDTERAPLADAWGRLPQSSEGVARLGSFTRARVERIIGIVIAVGCVALGAQGFFAALDPGVEAPGWHPAMEMIVFIPYLVMLVACFIGRGVRLFAGVFVVFFTGALVLWPVATSGVPIAGGAEPWIFFLLNIGTAASVLSFPLRLQVITTIVIPVLWGVVRLTQTGFAPAYLVPVPVDVSFALILGGIIVVLGWVFRTVAANVDAARAAAVASYASAAAADATEQERVAVGALMHDSVLAALLAVERAHSDRERTLAVGMSREALTRLANAERDASMGSEAPVAADTIAREIETSAAELGHPLRVERVHTTDVRLPGVVARALTLAAAQAIANAIQHAGAAGLRVSVACEADPVQVAVRVRDGGPGFDLHAIPDDRLGIRGSIIARVAAVGGRASIDSSPDGTQVTLEWAEGA